MSLYGITTDDDCRAKIDELLKLSRQATQALTKEKVETVKARLAEYYKIGSSQRGKARMSCVEQAFFWPAIAEAYVRAPNLNSPRTWREGLSEIESNLRYYRPRET
jgi:hypothetical protein